MINTIHTYKFNYKNTTNKFQFNIFSKMKIKVKFIWHIKKLETYISMLLKHDTFNF